MEEEVRIKIISAIVYGLIFIIFLSLVYKFPIVLPIGLTIIAFISQKELYDMFEKRNPKLNKALGIGLSILFIWLVYYEKEEIELFIFLIIVLIPIVLFLQKRQLPSISTSLMILFGVIYIGILLSFFIKVYKLGFFLLLFFIILTWANDIGCYVIGNAFKGPKLFPSISPNKTISGAIGGLIFCLIASLILSQIGIRQGYEKISGLSDIIFVAILLSVGAQVGDFYESWLKRIHGIKDTGNIIPEHGGLLDRIDSLLFTAPIIYFYLVL